MNAGVARAVREAGGALFAISSEPQTLAGEARESWQLDFPTVGDPHHEIADACRERGWLDLYVNTELDMLVEQSGYATHPKGVFQPGVLALSRAGRVLYRWRSRPGRHNAGGATHRPRAQHVWAGIRAGLERGDDAEDAPLDAPSQLDGRAPPWPIFVGLLLANGNFLRPNIFPLARGGPDDSRQRLARALVKLVLFAVAWLVAFALLPAAIVLALLGAWAVAVMPGLREAHRHFQNVPPHATRARD